MTNLALAISIDPQFSKLAQELVFMGGKPESADGQSRVRQQSRHEFNFWFDPEARRLFCVHLGRRLVCTPTDISIKTHVTPAMMKQIEASGTPLAHYVARFAMYAPGADIMWDELASAAWIDPTLITKSENSLHGSRPRPWGGIREHADLD